MTDRRLHIGAKAICPGWETLNVTHFEGLDHIMDARNLAAFPDKTFAAVYASHVVEHFDYKDELPAVLKEWHRVLAPGGKLFVSVPDLETLCRLFVDSELCDVNDRFRLMRMMFGGHTDLFDYHQVGLNWEFLTHYLAEAGFCTIRRVSEFGLFNDTSGTPFKGQLISLNLVAERANIANKPLDVSVEKNVAGETPPPIEASKHKVSVCTILIQKACHLREAGQARAALQLLEDLAGESESDAALLRERGLAYEQVGEYRLAATNLELAQLVLPGDFEAMFVLAMVLYRLGSVEESLTILERLLACVPELALLHGWKGQCLSSLKRGFEAHAAFMKARELQPDSASLLIQHGKHLVTWCHAEQAVELFERAIALEPHNPSACYELGRAYRSLGDSDKATLFFRRALQLSPNNKIVCSGYLFDLLYQNQLSPEQVADEHRQVCRQLYPDSDFKRSMPLELTDGRRLRIGYLSADFFMHSVMRFLEPVLRNHDRDRFEIVCYANVIKPDALTLKVQEMDLVWRDVVSLQPQQVAAQIEADGIDILVDLSGHTSGNRLDVCTLKPAPVQVSWLGYPHSTGLPQIDWYLSDNWCDPPGMTDHLYVERVWRLPELFCCYQSPESSPPVERTVGTPFTFGCFNNFSKISDTFLRVWAKILKQIPDSQLYLKSAAIGDAKSQQRIKRVFADCGISPDRIQCHSFVTTFEEHMACYQQVDIALDTFSYHGTTTTCEALWMGVPVVTLAGTSHLSRVGVSLLHAVGLDDLVALGPDEYVAIAVQLAGDKTRLADLRSSLQRTMERSSLMAHTAFTRNLEAAFTSMCARSN